MLGWQGLLAMAGDDAVMDGCCCCDDRGCFNCGWSLLLLLSLLIAAAMTGAAAVATRDDRGYCDGRGY
jgi:hypothetical protein